MQQPVPNNPADPQITKRVLTSAVVLLGLFCLLTTLVLAGGAYIFLRPGGLFDQSGLEDDLPAPQAPPASWNGVSTIQRQAGLPGIT